VKLMALLMAEHLEICLGFWMDLYSGSMKGCGKGSSKGKSKARQKAACSAEHWGSDLDQSWASLKAVRLWVCLKD